MYLFLERREGWRKRGRETSVCGCVSHMPYWGPGPQPRHVPWLGIEPATLCFPGQWASQSNELHQPGPDWFSLKVAENIGGNMVIRAETIKTEQGQVWCAGVLIRTLCVASNQTPNSNWLKPTKDFISSCNQTVIWLHSQAALVRWS